MTVVPTPAPRRARRATPHAVGLGLLALLPGLGGCIVSRSDQGLCFAPLFRISLNRPGQGGGGTGGNCTICAHGGGSAGVPTTLASGGGAEPLTATVAAGGHAEGSVIPAQAVGASPQEAWNGQWADTPPAPSGGAAASGGSPADPNHYALPSFPITPSAPTNSTGTNGGANGTTTPNAAGDPAPASPRAEVSILPGKWSNGTPGTLAVGDPFTITVEATNAGGRPVPTLDVEVTLDNSPGGAGTPGDGKLSVGAAAGAAVTPRKVKFATIIDLQPGAKQKLTATGVATKAGVVSVVTETRSPAYLSGAPAVASQTLTFVEK